MRIALCGNPNVGKTTIFNRLTRSDAPVGNWHGVTVGAREKKLAGTDVVLCDLPGAYSLTAGSKEEAVTRDGILFGDFDAVVFVAEVNNLRRNLYLFTQIAEAGKKAILVVNMMDEARGKVDLGLISKRLGVPVIGTSERHKNPKNEILAAVSEARVAKMPYAAGIAGADVSAAARNAGLAPAFAALKLMERDGYIAELMGKAEKPCGECAGCTGCEDIDRPAVMRYAYIDRALSGAVERGKAYALTDRIDRVVLGKAALPIFFLVMAAVFAVTFEAARPLSGLLTGLVELAAEPVRNASMPKWVCSFLADGIICGAGSVLAFLPQVLFLFLLTALLQDSGYMSRVAFVTDGFFKRFGISGRAAFSMILGLGCSATAVLSTRGIADATARKRTAFVTPFVPCSARLAVFTAVTAYFGLPGILVAAMYVLGVFAALATLAVMRKFGRFAPDEALLMEMPPYRLPSLKRVFKTVIRNIGSFVARVGTVVLCVSAIMWLLSNFSIGYGFEGGSDVSIMNTLAGLIAPVFEPLGFGDWRAVTALISGVAAKETLVSVIASLGGMGAVFDGPAAAVSFLIFSCLYVPCTATLAAIGKENGIKSALLSVAVHTVVAYIAALIYYQSTRLFAADIRLFATVYACVGVAIAMAIVINRIVRAKRKRKAA